MEAAFREAVEDLARNGTTVLLSSHILSEVEALCSRVTIIRAGRAVDSGALADLRHLTRTSVDAELAAPPPGLAGLAGVHGLDVIGNRVRCQVDAARLTRYCASSPRRGSRAWSASRPPWRNCSCGTTAPAPARGPSGRVSAPERGTAVTALAGTGALARLAARRDRILLPVWIYVLTAVVASTAYSLKKGYPTAADRAAWPPGSGTTPRSRRSTGPPTPPRSAASPPGGPG